MAPINLSWPDWKYPEWVDEEFRTSRRWLEKKKRDDGAEGLWRIHNGLYDLTLWADKHPGGKSWIKLTKVNYKQNITVRACIHPVLCCNFFVLICI